MPKANPEASLLYCYKLLQQHPAFGIQPGRRETGARAQWYPHAAVIYPDIPVLHIRARFYAGTFALQEALYLLEDQDEKAFERGIAQYR